MTRYLGWIVAALVPGGFVVMLALEFLKRRQWPEGSYVQQITHWAAMESDVQRLELPEIRPLKSVSQGRRLVSRRRA